MIDFTSLNQEHHFINYLFNYLKIKNHGKFKFNCWRNDVGIC